MMRARLIVPLLLVPFGIASADALPGAWKYWRYQRPIAAAAGTDLVSVVLPAEVHGRCRESLADLRVIDGSGDEVPYVLYARKEERSRAWRNAALSDAGHVEGRYTQVVADTGTTGETHNTVKIDVADSDYFTWITVEASDDREIWRIVRDRAPSYRFEENGLEGSNEISYPDTRSRWLRLRLAGEKELPVRSVQVGEQVVREPELVPWSARPDPGEVTPPGQSRFELDLGQDHVPVAAVRVRTTAAEFHRPVRVSVLGERQAWRKVAEGNIYRYRIPGKGDEPREQLEFRFPESQGRHWRVSVFDRNDPPLEELAIELLGSPRHVVFRPESGSTFRLIYGNSRAEAPSYELARLTVREDWEQARPVELSAESENDAWVSPEPWTERHPAVLWTALGLAVVVLGGLAIRALRG